ncbi:MAG: hypothetical protein ACM3X3_08665 [Betaproteobacteria bacterium]
MKRMTLGTIALIGALAVVTVKLPSVILGLAGAVAGADGRGGGAAKGAPLVSFQRLEALSPLVIKRGAPSLPTPGTLSLPILATEETEPQKPGTTAGEPGVSLGLSQDRSLSQVSESESGVRVKEPTQGEAPAVTAAVLAAPAVAAAQAPLASVPVVVSDRATTEGNSGPSPLSLGDSLGDRSEAATVRAPTPQLPATAPAAAASGGGGRDSGEAPLGFVVLEEAVKRHPLWAKLVSVEQEMDSSKEEWQREVDASGLTQSDIDECYAAAERLLTATTSRGDDEESGGIGGDYAGTIVKRLEETEARLRDETAQRIEARAAEVKAKLEDDLYAERARLNQEFDEFKDKTLKEYYVSLLNAELKLKLLNLPDDERKALQEKLAKLTVEMQMKIDAKAAEQDAAFQAYAEKRRAEADAEIAAFQKAEEQSLSEKLAGERAKLEESLADLLNGTDPSLNRETQQWREEAVRRAKIEVTARRDELAREFAAKEAAFTEKYRQLQARRDALYKRICDDIRAAARKLEADTGMKVSVLEGAAPASSADGSGTDAGAGAGGGIGVSPDGAVDVTEKVLQIIRNR